MKGILSMKYLADTNLILRVSDRNSPANLLSRTAVKQLKGDGHQICILAQNCIEFWNVATRPRQRNGLGLSIAEAEQRLRMVERIFPILPDTPEIYDEWRRLIIQYSVAGVKVHDTRLVAAMQVHDITYILTLNGKDFKRFAAEGIVPVDPAVV